MGSWKSTCYGTGYRGYKNKICFRGERSFESNTSWDQHAFSWILIHYIRGRSDQNKINPVWRLGRIPPPWPCESYEATKREVWDSKIWSQVPRDEDPRNTALARASSIYKRQTHPLVREGAQKKQDRNSRGTINIWSCVQGGCSIPRLTDWLAVSRNVTWTWTWTTSSWMLRVRFWSVNQSLKEPKDSLPGNV
jgi:hypothetical protein